MPDREILLANGNGCELGVKSTEVVIGETLRGACTRKSVIGRRHRDRTSSHGNQFCRPYRPTCPATGDRYRVARCTRGIAAHSDHEASERMTWRLATTSRVWALPATIRKFHRAHHATCNHRRRCWFDGASRDFLLDENGFYQQSHPVDQEVDLVLCVSRGPLHPRRASETSFGRFPAYRKASRKLSRARTFVRVWRLSWRPSRSRCRTSRSIKASRTTSVCRDVSQSRTCVCDGE